MHTYFLQAQREFLSDTSLQLAKDKNTSLTWSETSTGMLMRAFRSQLQSSRSLFVIDSASPHARVHRILQCMPILPGGIVPFHRI
jgi:hypothetical protein